MTRRRISILLAGLVAAASAVVGVPRPAYAFPTPIQHIVVIYQENHTFDNVLGDYCNLNPLRGCSGFPASVHMQDGVTVSMRQAPDIVPQVIHSVQAQTTAIDGGLMDGWDKNRGCTRTTTWQGAIPYGCMTYYAPSQIPNTIALATKFAISDATFSLADSPSWGGHMYAASGTTDGFSGNNPNGQTNGWGCDSGHDAEYVGPSSSPLPRSTMVPACVPDPSLDPTQYPYGGAYRATPAQYVPTIMDRLDQAGLTWNFYAASPGQGGYIWSVCPTFAECRYGQQMSHLKAPTSVVTDAQAGNLPTFSLVLAGPGTAIQHNGMSMGKGDNYIGSIVSAIENGPDWGSTAIFITYDDCGCFYDHVPPPVNAEGQQEGPRVPMIIVSPYARAGYTDHTPTTFAGLLAYEEHTLGLTPLGPNDTAAYDFTGAFDYTQTPIQGPRMQQGKVTTTDAPWAESDDT